jgi:hypothetical protein
MDWKPVYLRRSILQGVLDSILPGCLLLSFESIPVSLLLILSFTSPVFSRIFASAFVNILSLPCPSSSSQTADPFPVCRIVDLSLCGAENDLSAWSNTNLVVFIMWLLITFAALSSFCSLLATVLKRLILKVVYFRCTITW